MKSMITRSLVQMVLDIVELKRLRLPEDVAPLVLLPAVPFWTSWYEVFQRIVFTLHQPMGS